MATKGYELLADEYHETTSKPGEPFTFKTYRKGDTIQLDAENARRLIEADAVVDPNADGSQEPGGETVAPEGKVTDEVPAGTGSAPGDTSEPPSRSGSKADWVAYATAEARGDDRLTAEEADAATRDELAERFLGPKES